MKNYGLNRMKHREQIVYNFVRAKYFVLKYATRSEKKKEFYDHLYTRHFKKQKTCFDHDYSIPYNKHCDPVCLLTSDLILRDDIPALKKGLVRLLRELTTHKYITINRSFDEIVKTIETMDDTLTWSSQSTRIGIFDFEPYKDLAAKISDFELTINQVNPSYLSIESRICFTPEYTAFLQNLINSDVKGPRTYIGHGFTKNKKRSGGKRSFTLCEYNTAMQKADLIHESITSLKWQFYNKLHDYIPVVLHSIHYAPPGIIFYQTNIDYWDESANHFWESLGFNITESHFVNDAEKLFYNMQLSGRYGRHAFSDAAYIYHEGKIELEAGIQNLYYQIVENFSWNFSNAFFKFRFLDMLNSIYARKLIDYKLKLNRIKLKKRCLHSLLKLRFAFEKDMDMYSRFLDEANFEQAEKEISELFSKKKQRLSWGHEYITKLHTSSAAVVQKRMEAIAKEFDGKSSVLQHLENYKHESRNRFINYIMFGIAVLTLVLLIFPGWSSDIATFLRNAWEWFLGLLENIRELISVEGDTMIEIEEEVRQATMQ